VGKLLVIESITWKLMKASKLLNLELIVILNMVPVLAVTDQIPAIDSELLTTLMFNLDAHSLVIRQT